MGLSVLGVALGVAVVVSIDLANSSAKRAFNLSAESVTGKATHQIVGAGEGVDEALYAELRTTLGLRDIAPVVEGYAASSDAPGRTLQILGVDPFAEAPFRPYVGGEDNELDLAAFIARPRTAVIARPLGETLDKGLGDSLRIAVGGVPHALAIIGLIEASDDRSTQAIENLVIVDVGVAQEVLGKTGVLSRLDLIVPEGATGEGLLADIGAALPEGVEVRRASARTETVEQMTRAFELNLAALSLLALVVGMFLIYNTMTFSVVQRRPLVGRLRALGVTRQEVFRLVLGEALAIGVVGTLLGVALGVVLGQGLVRLVTQTINDLYYVLTVRELHIDTFTLIKGIGLGIGATLMATWAPAREATHAPASTVLQRSQQETNIRVLVPRLAAMGVALGVVGGALLFLPTRNIVVSYIALLCTMLAFACLVPGAVVGFGRVVRPLMGHSFGILGRMAASGMVANLSRTAVAIAALMVAIAATIGVGVMVTSFRSTVVTWLDHTLRADVFISAPSLVFRSIDTTLDKDLVDQFTSSDLVETASYGHKITVRYADHEGDLIAPMLPPQSQATFRFKAGEPATVWQAFEEDEGLIISEPYAFRYDKSVGDVLTMQTDVGERSFAVAGIYYDYGSDLGTVLMNRETFNRYFDDDRVSTLALYLKPDVDPDQAVAAFQQMVPAGQEVLIRSNQTLRTTSLEVFDRTFTITTVLRLLAIGVAFIGVLTALMALQLERARELAILRATGLTPPQVWRYVTLQTGLMGLISGILAVPLGIVLAAVLVFVINKRSFGWTLQLELTPEVLLQALVLALVAAVLAGLYPAWKMSKANPAHALREE